MLLRYRTPPPLILVVEDDDAVRNGLAFALELEGFDVEAWTSGEDALGRTATRRVQCAVLDQRLPGLSGLDTLKQLRVSTPGLPAILITTHPPPALRAAAAVAGVRILEKPLMGEALGAMIREAIDAGA